jgi:hypothetical protein
MNIQHLSAKAKCRNQVHLLDRYLLQREGLEEILTVEFQGSWDKIVRSTEE